MIASRSRFLVVGAACAATAVLAALVSIGRLRLTNAAALADIVWAEDGLFPLCARAHGALRCLVEPYAGYLLALPRAVAWPVSLAPIDQWPLATNLAAALLAGLAAATALAILRASGAGWACSIFVSLLPVLAPIVGVEAINATASSYLLLPFIVCLAFCLPPRSRFPTILYAVGAVACAMTLPSSAVLVLPLLIQAWRGRIPRRSVGVVGAGLLAGLLAQGIAITTASSPRSLDFSVSAVREFAGLLPGAFLDDLPAASGSSGLPWLGVAVAIGVLGGGVALILRRGYLPNAAGLLLVCGLGFGVIPASIGDPNNRYFVLPVLLWTAALVVAIDRSASPRWREAVTGGTVAVLIVAFVPHLPASHYRADARPRWDPMLARARLVCLESPNGSVGLTFSPNWPEPARGLSGLTTNVVPCRAIDEFGLQND